MTARLTLRADRLTIPFRRPFPTAAGMWLARETWLIRLRAGDGRTGVGEAVLEPSDGEAAATVLEHLIREAATLAASDGLPPPHELDQHGAPGRALRAALDAARFDLAEAPAPPLGPGGVGVGVNATIPNLGPAASAEAARQAIEAGFSTLKLKVGAERETDVLVARVGAIRAAVGPDVHLRLDANGAWDLETATERLAAVARYGLEYAEQPLAGDDPAALAKLRRRVRVPIAADEAVTSPRAARTLIDAGAADVLVVKPVRVGGRVPAAEIADLAANRGVPVVVSTLFETGIGIAAALAVAAALPDVPGRPREAPPDHGLATAGLLEHDLLVHSLIVEDGRMRLPDGPRPHERPDGGPPPGGLGVGLDERALERFLVDSVEAVG